MTKLKELAACEFARQTIKEKGEAGRDLLKELQDSQYPLDIIEQIKEQIKPTAANIITKYQRARPLLTKFSFLKNLINRRIQRGDYNEEEITILQNYITDLEENVLPSYGDEPHVLISKIEPNEIQRILNQDLLTEITDPAAAYF